jgi:uncharacterized protein (DUF305 family)
MPRLPVLAALAVLAPAPAALAEGVDPTHDYAPGEAPVTSTWFRRADPAAAAADRRYIAGMRPHHAGALSMAEEYLRNPEARSPALRRLAEAIIANQRHEIALLDDVARQLDAEPTVLFLGPVRVPLQPIGTEGLGSAWRFQKAPIPGRADLAAGPPPTAEDVRFAKAMTVHHQAALDMVRDYRADPAARNGYLGWLNVGIETDQSQEIALMRAAVRRFPGDPDSVRVDPSMVHGMEGHGHGGGAHGPAPAAPAASHDGHHHHGGAAHAPPAAEAPPRRAHRGHAPAAQPPRQRREPRPADHRGGHHHHHH